MLESNWRLSKSSLDSDLSLDYSKYIPALKEAKFSEWSKPNVQNVWGRLIFEIKNK